MRMNREAVVDRIVSALFDHEKAVGDALSELQEELRKRDQEDEARAKQMVADSLYTIARVEPVKWKDVGDTIRETNRIAERIRIRRAQLPAFASKHGLRLDELMSVVELRKREVTGKGKTWRAGGNALFVDHEA